MTEDGYPRSLVHGATPQQTNGGKVVYSRDYPLGQTLVAKPGTPGFNCFISADAAIRYLPRFRVRASRLYLCKVEVLGVRNKTAPSAYILADSMVIHLADWSKRIRGDTLLQSNSRTT